MEGQADFTERETNGETVLHFTGRLTVARIVDLDDRLTDMAIRPAKADISEVERVDTVGAWILHKLKRDYGTKIVGASNNVASGSNTPSSFSMSANSSSASME